MNNNLKLALVAMGYREIFDPDNIDVLGGCYAKPVGITLFAFLPKEKRLYLHYRRADNGKMEVYTSADFSGTPETFEAYTKEIAYFENWNSKAWSTFQSGFAFFSGRDREELLSESARC